MYSPSVTEQQLQDALPAAQRQWFRAGGKGKFVYERLTSRATQQFADHINQLRDDRGRLRRDLTLEEQRIIINERTLARWDFSYYLNHYYKIEHWSGSGFVLFEPNIAQSIILDTWAERETQQLHIAQLSLKARQEGVTTLCQAAVAHRVQFHPDTSAVVGSSRPEKSRVMVDKALKAWYHMPWFIRPLPTIVRAGEVIEFGGQNTSISIQHGAKVKSGVARGSTPSVVHLSECSEYLNPEEDVDSAIVFAMHPSPKMFLILESTAKGQDNWWHRKWREARDRWGNPMTPTLLQPVFLPWYIARDIYPTETWLRSSPIPAAWSPATLTERHARKAEDYVRNTTLLAKHLGPTWSMPREQLWFWETVRAQYQREGALNKFYQEMCVAAGTRVSTGRGIIPIEKAMNAETVETGRVEKWHHNDVKPILRLTTKNGRVLRATPDHRVLLADGSWREMKDLSSGDRITLSPPAFSAWDCAVHWTGFPVCTTEVRITPILGRLLGYFMGDGCFMSGGISISCFSEDEDVIADVRQTLLQVTGREPTGQRIRGKRLVLVESHSQTQWRQLLQTLGCIAPRHFPGKPTRNGFRKVICVPEAIWRSSISVVKEFLSALFETDGHAYKKAAATRFFTKDLQFARDVQLLLLGFGINAILRQVAKKAGNGSEYAGCELQLNARASDLFHERIGFIGARKQAGRRSANVGRKASPHVMEDEVISVEPDGESEVYDLTISETHRFGANGIMVHNCADDVEAFQHEGTSVFDAELIMRYNDIVRRPVVIYGLDGPSDEIRPELKPDFREIDHNRAPIKIDVHRETGHRSSYHLVPLRMDGYPIQFNPEGKILMWERPQDSVEYGLGIDTAQGIGLDSSVIEVLRKATVAAVARQCCEFASPWISASDLFPYAHSIAKLYSRRDDQGSPKQPKIVVETNNGGDACQLALRKAGWGNMHPWIRYDKKTIDASKATHVGVVTTVWSRDLVIGHLIKALRDGSIDIDSRWFVQEMQSLVKDPDKARIAAHLGAHDDRFMAMGWIYLSMHILEFGEIKSTFGMGRILDEVEIQKPAVTRPPAPEELPIMADTPVVDRYIMNRTPWPRWGDMDSA